MATLAGAALSWSHATWKRLLLYDDSPTPGPHVNWLARNWQTSLAMLSVLALCLRLPGISASFYGDESFSLLRDSNELLTSTEDRFRPVFFTLLYLWKQLGFSGETGLRALPLTFGLLQVPVACALGRRLAGPRAGLLFGFFIAVNPLLIEFSQELRMYSLVPLIALLNALAFAMLLERYERREPTAKIWFAFVLSALVGVYTHFHYWILIPGFAVALFRQRTLVPLRDAALGLGSICVLYLPNIPNVLRFQRQAEGLAHFLAKDVASALPKALVANTVGFNYFVLPDLGIDRAVGLSVVRQNLPLALLLAVPALLLGFGLLRAMRQPDLKPLLWFGSDLFIVPTLVAFVALVGLGRNFIHPKYMVFSTPFLALLLTAGALALRRTYLVVALAAGGVAVVGVALVHFNEPTQYGRREDWRGLAAYLHENAPPDATLLGLRFNDAVVEPPGVSKQNPESIWTYYNAGDLQARIREIGPIKDGTTREGVEAELSQLTEGHEGVYYIWTETARNFADPNDVVLSTLRGVCTEEQLQRFNPRLALFRFESCR